MYLHSVSANRNGFTILLLLLEQTNGSFSKGQCTVQKVYLTIRCGITNCWKTIIYKKTSTVHKIQIIQLINTLLYYYYIIMESEEHH